MKILPIHTEAIRYFGYTEEEAQFIYLVATHSGYFTCQQFLQFIKTKPGKRSAAFARKILQKKHASAKEYLRNGRVFHLFSRNVYEAIGRENVRFRRVHSTEYIRTRLIAFDFILRNRGFTYLESEEQKVTMIKTEANAWRVIEHRKLDVNPDRFHRRAVTIGMLVNRYLETELAELRHSTANAYRSYLNHQINPRWGDCSLSKVKPFAVEQWLKDLDLAPRTKGHLHNLMRVLWNCAMRWELAEIGENPMKLVRVRGSSKRRREPVVLGVDQFHLLLKELDDPFRTMVILDLATGLRCSELFALQWRDVLWEEKTLLVRRGIVTGVVSDVKTKYSNAGMPLDPALAEVLRKWQRKTHFKNPEDWVFASPFRAGKKPWEPWSVERRHIIPAAIRCGIGRIGWHSFRHTFRTLLDETGAPMKVQQELMRHADIRTTMNVYGKAMDASKREAHGKVVRMVLAAKVA